MRRLRILGLALLLSTPTLAAEPTFAPTTWKPLFVGVDLCELKAEKPRLMRGFAVRIDLKADGIAFLATPGNGDRPGETDGLYTSTFLKTHKLQLAINAAPFSPVRVDNLEGKALDVVGVQLSRGKLISEPDGRHPALLIHKNKSVTIADPPFDFSTVQDAVGGFQIVLKGGKVIEGGQDIHPRTGAGISADGRYLYLLILDGRQKEHSDGATTGEVGMWLKTLGAADGINLDGGGTTTLAIEGPGGSAKVLNRPIHAGIPGLERVSASHLGVYAKPLAK